MTIEELKTIYDRAVQYCIAKYNTEPLSIEIEIDGSLAAEYLESRGCCGDPDEYSHHYFSIDDLSSDLDALIIERKEREAKEAEKRRLYEIEQKKEREQNEKDYRRREFQKLKREFEP